jgi:hypothetical protein
MNKKEMLSVLSGVLLGCLCLLVPFHSIPGMINHSDVRVWEFATVLSGWPQKYL